MPRHGDNLSVYQQRSGWRSCGAHTQRDAIQPRKEQNSAICNSTGGPRDYHAKWSKSENDKYHTTYHTYISLIHGTWFLKMIQMDLFTKQRQTDMHGKQPCGDQRESAVRGISQELGVNAHTTIYKTAPTKTYTLKICDNSHTYRWENKWKNNEYVYMLKLHYFAVYLTLIQHCKSTMRQYFF